MNSNPLIQAEELANYLFDPKLVIIDARFYLGDPQQGKREFSIDHIPGARYVSLDRDLSSPRTQQTGRHPWPFHDKFGQKIQQLGIEPSSTVVVYDSSDGAMASRFWMLMVWIGFDYCKVLDGGYAHYKKLNLPITGQISNAIPSSISLPDLVRHDLILTTQDIEKIYTSTDYLLLDARSPDRFRGENETIDPVAGHIPGARNRHYLLNLSPIGLFKTPDQLRNEFNPLVSQYQPDHIISYCGSGVTACHNILAMRIAGYPFPRLYAGAWSEWIRNPHHPIETNF